MKSLRIKRHDFTKQSLRSIVYLIPLFFFILPFGCKKDEVPNHDQIRKLLTHRSLGLAYLEENQLDKAVTEFNQVIEIAPDEALGHANLALTYLRKTQYQEAEKHAQKALQLSREPEIHLIYAEVLERTGKPDAAITELQHSVKASANHIPSQYKLAQLYLRSSGRDRYQKAEKHLLAIEMAAP
ncbi:MAG: tetratricopeptide repeat protein, partial [Acidobacteriota bacterium]